MGSGIGVAAGACRDNPKEIFTRPDNQAWLIVCIMKYMPPMKQKTSPADPRRDAFRERIEALWPLAKGSVSEVRKPCTRPGCKACASGQKHPALIFTYRKDGKLRCRHVRPGQEAVLRQAIENGRTLERLLVEAGEELLRSLRD